MSDHPHLGRRFFYAEKARRILFTENETNKKALFNVANDGPYTKDAFHRAIVKGEAGATNPHDEGTKCAAVYELDLDRGESATLRLRFTDENKSDSAFVDFDDVFAARMREADDFWNAIMPQGLDEDSKRVFRQGAAGLLWSKQFYHFDVERWLRGDPNAPAPPEARRDGKNAEWTHLFNSEVLSMPDKWEYPWYAAWDLAFHSIPIAIFDPELAKTQLSLLTREWYMHPNGQLPAYEWAFGDVNPPVHAWAADRVFQIEKKMTGRCDRGFLESVFHKLMLNFTWWVNRKDAKGRNVFQGGFLGLDNIGVFDRSTPLPNGHVLEQADATSWMGMYCLNLLEIALELARENQSYEDVANKFFEHFLLISKAANLGDEGGQHNMSGLWDEDDGFFYDCVSAPRRHAHADESALDGRAHPALRGSRRSTATCSIDFRNSENAREVVSLESSGARGRDRIDPRQGLGGSGGFFRFSIGAASFACSRACSTRKNFSRRTACAAALAGASRSSVRVQRGWSELSRRLRARRIAHGHVRRQLLNWRGPDLVPREFSHHRVAPEVPPLLRRLAARRVPARVGAVDESVGGRGRAARGVSRCLFLRDEHGRRAAHGTSERFQNDPNFRDNILFYEYFHGDTGEGLGASHQTGWTALVVKLIQQSPLWSAQWDETRARMSIHP